MQFEQTTPETDRLWTPDRREPDTEVQKRAYAAMSVIMSRECVESYSLPLQASDTDEISSLSDRPRVISVTSHSGLIRNLMPSLNHDVVTLGTAGLLPMLLRADCEEVHSPAVVSTNAIEKADDETKRVFLI